MDQTIWGVVGAAVGRLGPWGVHLRYPFPSAIWFTIRRPFRKRKRVITAGNRHAPNCVLYRKHTSFYESHTLSKKQTQLHLPDVPEWTESNLSTCAWPEATD